MGLLEHEGFCELSCREKFIALFCYIGRFAFEVVMIAFVWSRSTEFPSIFHEMALILFYKIIVKVITSHVF